MAPTSVTDLIRRQWPHNIHITDLNLFPAASTTLPLGALVARDTSVPTDIGNDDDSDDNRSIVNYYFVFFALLVCIAGLCAYFVWRRRRNALLIYNNQRQTPFPRDVREWDTVRYRRRYWNTGFRSAPQASREEGLNENGEAPPPYMPKDNEETGNNGAHVGGHNGQGEGGPGGPAIPMQTLSREQAGLKPPDYEQSMRQDGGGSSGSAPAR